MLIKKILIGVDNSKFADNAAQYGFDIAHQFKAQVALVHIVEPALIPYNNIADPLSGTPDIGMEEVELINIQNNNSKNLIDNVIKKYGGDLEVTHFSDFGDTADGIVNCAQNFGADMIVVGTHSRSGLDRLLMGSIAEHVVRNATVPVLVVPMNEEDEE
jgi:nucleotide-binding universal stress UspA family protein